MQLPERERTSQTLEERIANLGVVASHGELDTQHLLKQLTYKNEMNNGFMQSKQISNNGVHLFSESLGSPNDASILLIMGAMSSGI